MTAISLLQSGAIPVHAATQRRPAILATFLSVAHAHSIPNTHLEGQYAASSAAHDMTDAACCTLCSFVC